MPSVFLHTCHPCLPVSECITNFKAVPASLDAFFSPQHSGKCFPEVLFSMKKKTSAENMILQIFDIFTNELSLFSTHLSNKFNWVEKRLNS